MKVSRRLVYDNFGKTSAKAVVGAVMSGRMSSKTDSEEFATWLKEDLKKRKSNQEVLDDQVKKMRGRRKRNLDEAGRKRRKGGEMA